MAASSPLKTLSRVCAFGGYLNRFEHVSAALGNLPMKFAVFVPDQAQQGNKVGTLFYLSGLTCTDENVSQKGSIGFKYASELGIAMVMPDTSPRGHEEIPGENDSYDFGTGAGFYLNATKAPWNKHYNMYSYVVDELPSVLQAAFPEWYVAENIAITGHSMGGHGALTIALKNPQKYKSVSAFAPICNPTQVPWGQKAFEGYLENPEAESAEYDAVKLLEAGKRFSNSPLKVDQGGGDNFYVGEVNQLQPAVLEAACAKTGQALELKISEGYDHSYWFISSFMEDHLRFHGKYLKM